MGSILFTLSQIKLLNTDSDWKLITEVFRDRMLKEYDQEKVIKGITSLSLANVTGHDDFWIDTFEIIEKRIKAEDLDAYLKMNLFWSMGKNVGMLHPHILESIVGKLLPTLVRDIELAMQQHKEQVMVSFIPNLVWSCRILGIKDEALWRVIDRMIFRIYKYFNLDMLQSVVPSYYEVGRVSSEQDKIFEVLEKRFRDIKA